MAKVRLEWRTAEEGGRHSPPPGPLYAATAILADSREQLLEPGWVIGKQHISIATENRSSSKDGQVDAVIDFFAARELAVPWLKEGAWFGVMEGHRLVALGEVEEVLPWQDPNRPGQSG